MKIVITCRKSLLPFLPVESDDPEKNAPDEAVKYLEELRFISFGDCRQTYQNDCTALEVRNAFMCKFPGSLISLPLPTRFAGSVWQDGSEERQGRRED